MIISASRRTDIPAFYSQWFFNRIEQGFALVPNPFNPSRISRVSLLSEDVDALVFWTKDPRPMMSRLGELDRKGYRYYFQFTLTDYGAELEVKAPFVQRMVDAFIELSKIVGPERVIWRYDPIIISNKTDFPYHKFAFKRLGLKLAGHTKRVMISFVSWYRKTQRRVRVLEDIGWQFDENPALDSRVEPFLESMAKTAKKCEMEIFTCAQKHDFSYLDILPGSCVDGKLIENIWGIKTPARTDKGQRKYCLCAPSKDIGMVNTCIHGCRYCYSTVNHSLAVSRNKSHDPKSPIKWGEAKAPEENVQLGLFGKK